MTLQTSWIELLSRTLHPKKYIFFSSAHGTFPRINIYTPNTEAPKYIKQILTVMKGETDSNTIRVGDFNTPLTSMDRSSRQKISKETLALNDTLDQMDLIPTELSIPKE